MYLCRCWLGIELLLVRGGGLFDPSSDSEVGCGRCFRLEE